MVRLAARAVEGVPGVDVSSLYRADHSLPAAAARPASPFVHPVLLAARQLPGGGLLRTVGVCQEKPASQRHHGAGIDVADRRPGRYPQQEAHLRLVQVSNPDQHWISTYYLTCVNTRTLPEATRQTTIQGRFWAYRCARAHTPPSPTPCGDFRWSGSASLVPLPRSNQAGPATAGQPGHRPCRLPQRHRAQAAVSGTTPRLARPTSPDTDYE
jgi:hypothetical protein